MAGIGPKKQSYRPIHSEDTDSESSDTSRFIEPESCQKSHLRLIAPWIASTLFLSLITGYLLFQQPRSCSACPSAFRTDLRDAHAYIFYEERVFSGKLGFNEELGKVYRDIDRSEPQYVGPPSPEIDGAWADLLRDGHMDLQNGGTQGEFVRMTDEEAAPYTPELNKAPSSDYYHFEPDMFHSLHCLNAIRIELDEDYYSKHPHPHHADLEQAIRNSTNFPDNWDRIHRDHCLDQLRQAIQCHGDLSPVPVYHYNNDRVGLGVEQVHTCRKWEPMRKWMDIRKANQQ
ncbi:uncharacterized protein N7482_005122 [Penicillium canariense]|uniref:Uncharacterized protein n=1 Tax=Penicillium canariense TaxID=189055 RepID=A0A9W9I1X1_9EURO|nr:uncharacterized protein N7482_005122 [Penicillium canariense]KAJ5166341.1 hypothetical protein N7482_005122 [Penicillium canariense]